VTKKQALGYYRVAYRFTHKSGHTSDYALTVPAETAEDAALKAADRMRREGTPMDQVTMLGATLGILS